MRTSTSSAASSSESIAGTIWTFCGGLRRQAASSCLIQGWASCPGVVPSGDSELVKPAASGIPRRPVEPGDVGLDVDDRGPVEEIDAGEGDELAGHLEKLDEA